MTMGYGMRAAILAAALALSATANATIIFSETFDGENGGASALNYNAFTQFAVDGQVDLIASGEYGPLCAGGSGSCVDLDGTPGSGAIYTTPIAFGANRRVTIEFDLSGSQRRSDSDDFFASLDFGSGANIAYYGYNFDGTDVIVPVDGMTMGTSFWVDVSGFDPMTLRSIFFAPNDEGAVKVGFGTASADRIGPVIDNIIASVTAVPEPNTWSLMIAGFGLAGVLMRRRHVGIVSFS